MLPGVGAFGAAMARLVELGLDGVLRERIAADRPTMAICVGHQLLFATSDESPGVRGLGIVPGMSAGSRATCACRSSAGTRCGRARTQPDRGRLRLFRQQLPRDRRTRLDGGVRDAWRPYVAAMERGKVVGCQFHPELSGAYGEALLARFLELG